MNKEEIIKRLKDILKHTTVTEKTVIIPKYILDPAYKSGVILTNV